MARDEERERWFLGKDVSVNFGTYTVNGRVVHTRYAFGRTDLLVQPRDGSGEFWVDSDNCSVLGE